MQIRYLAACALLHFVGSVASHAAIPHTIPFQGILANASGVPKPAGSYNVTFRLFDAATAGSPLWTEASKPVSVTGSHGLFTTELGAPTSFGGLAFDTRYWVEIQLDGEASPMTPRLALDAVPYALTAGGGALSLPFTGNAAVASPGTAMSITNTGNGNAITGTSAAVALSGLSSGWWGAYGRNGAGSGLTSAKGFGGGVWGDTDNGIGVKGQSASAWGVYGEQSGPSGIMAPTAGGVWGDSLNTDAVMGTSGSAVGIYGESGSYLGVNGVGHTAGLPAVYGQNDNAAGDGVWGSGGNTGVWGDSGPGTGVFGLSERGQYGVIGESTQGFAGIWGHGAHNGLYGQTSSAADNGVIGRNEAGGTGVFGYSIGGTGVIGRTESDGKTGVFGYTNHNNGSIGVWGANDGNGAGVQGNSGGGDGVIGFSNATIHAGVSGINLTTGYGVYGQSNGGGYAGYFAGLTHVGILEISGGSDVAEKFSVAGAAQPGTVVSIDTEHAGALRLSTGAYDRTVAGVISGANHLSAGMVLPDSGGVAGALPVAMAGRVWVRCNDSDGPIHPGDMLTTSDTAGVAMKVTDYSRSEGATIGKAMSPLEHGTGLVLALVNLH
ncbi:MAG TPA: hypothetical protein VGM51_02075 [Armatimonadota bacterium]